MIETELANFIEDSSPNEDSVRLVTLCRSGGKIVGGLSGGTSYRWLAIAYLWVDKTYRGQGIGKRLLAMAEDEARRRGCVHSRVFTHDFQAPEFYLQNSYRCQGVLPDIPPGHEQYCFIKDI
ncbi:MAG: hypothetical protein A2Y33_12765 [Spirochaetes bacterium GWF1_51_8]|nr:MAG: hypothetical protein A2Y33_12765 [Spirochaetes bacterium GWF1_51_8]